MYDKLESIKVFQKNRNGNYITFSNKDEKVWVVPRKNMRTGLEIYEPSGIKGKLLKESMPVLSQIGGYKFMPGCYHCEVELADQLKTLLDSLYQQYELSIFWGTPSTDQKVTIQIFNGNKIQGYCKVGNSARVCSLFKHEENILNELEQCGMESVPRCKGVFSLKKGEMAFVQTTQKEVGAKVEHELGKKHEFFLQMLFDKTKEPILFEKSDFYESLIYLKNNVKKLKLDYQECVAIATDEIMRKYKNQQVLWGICHRDFTPWNTCIAEGKLFAFDFEYAHRYAPKTIDKWHFYTQTAIYEKKMTPYEIANEFTEKHKESVTDYLMYLLDNISLYLMRGERTDIEIANNKALILHQVEKNS